MDNNPTMIGGIVLITLGLVEIIKILIRKSIGRTSMLTKDEKLWLRELWVLHSAKDQNGINLMYFPRDISTSQKEILTSLRQVSLSQEKTAYILEGLVRRIENLNNRD